MSIISMFVCFGFLGFFLFLVPLSIYIFAKLFPEKYPGFIGFPDRPVSTQDTPAIVSSDHQSSHPSRAPDDR